MSNSHDTIFGHPKGLFVLFLTEMWERFSFYGMRAILLLFLVKSYDKGGMNLDDTTAGAIYGLYTASVYLLSLPGGWLADKYLGQKKSIWYGGIVIMLGHLVLAFDAGSSIFYAGLCLVALGTGLLKPNISSIVGELYPEGGARRDSAFSIFYMGINLGGAIGMLTVGYLGEKIGWHIGFGAAAIAMFLGLILFRSLSKKYLVGFGEVPAAKAKTTEVAQPKNNLALYFAIIFVVLMGTLQYFNYIDLTTIAGFAAAMTLIIVLVSIFYFVYLYIAGGLDATEKNRLKVLFIFFMASAIFWAGYEQGGSGLSTFADRYTNRIFGTWEMPASWFQGLQSIYVILLSPVFAAIWAYFAHKNIKVSSPLKFAFSMFFLALAFVVMYFGANVVVGGSMASPAYLTICFLFTVVGELCLSPVGLSYYTKLAPKRYVSQLMGIWFVGTSVGNLIAGQLARVSDVKNLQDMPQNYLNTVLFVSAFGVILMLFSKKIQTWTGGIE